MMTAHSPQKFPKALNALSLATYLLQRIDDHTQIYKPMISPFVLKTNERTLFLVLYLVMNGHLNEGHTVLWLHNQSLSEASDPWSLSDYGFVGWQFEIVKKLLALVDEATGEVYCTFGADLSEFLSLSDSQLKSWVGDLNQRLTNKANRLGVGERQILGELIDLIFRFMYLCHKPLGGQLKSLYGYLQMSIFCGDDQDSTHSASIFRVSEWQNGFGLWLTRSYLAEQKLTLGIYRLASRFGQTSTYTPTVNMHPLQAQAIALALNNRFAIITGGPGTGKTFTIAQLVIYLLEQNPNLQLALVAPTGKAAKRMQESLQQALGEQMRQLPEAMTIHRLLGMGATGVSRFDQKNPLPFHVIVVDEASMLGVELAQKLVLATGTNTRLILLGDANQLAAVEAGAVLADLCHVPFLSHFHVQLMQSKRFDESSALGRLSHAIQDNHSRLVFDLLQNEPSLAFVDVKKASRVALYDKLYQGYLEFVNFVAPLRLGKMTGQPKIHALHELFKKLAKYRILTASHQGDFGDHAINHAIAQMHFIHQYPKRSTAYLPQWYHGRVVMVTKNSYDLGLFNGDVGVCVYEHDGRQGQFVVYFEGKDEAVACAMLSTQMISTAYAITIHKSQGSEFDQVAMCFDDANHKLLARELLYTGVTRAKHGVLVYATQSSLMTAISMQTLRQTGLAFFFERLKPLE